MKLLFAATLLLLAANPQAKAADYTSCRSELQQIGSDYADYYAQQDDKCKAAIDSPPATRPWDITIASLCKNALAQLRPIKNRSAAACDKCRSVDDKLADACTDNGVSVFIAKVRAL